MANFEDYLNDYNVDDGFAQSAGYDDYKSDSGDYGYDTAASYNDGYSDSAYSDNAKAGYEDDFAPAYSNARNDYSDYNEYSEEDYRGKSNEYDDYDDEQYEDEEPRGKAKFKNPIKPASTNAISGLLSGHSPLLLGMMALCVLLSIISIVSVSQVKKSVNETREMLSSQISSLTAATGDLAERVSAIETGVSTVQAATTVPGTSKYITIAKQPTSVSSYVGRGEDSLAMFFSVAAKGNGLTLGSFQWQKQDASGSWINVGFDGTNSKNESFGLQNEVGKYDSGDYAGCLYSIIYSYGLTSQGFGQYRCVISDTTGEQAISDIVEIRNNG